MNVRLIDMNVQSLTDADYAWGDDVYLSAMLTQARSFDAVAEKAKALGKTTIAGGPYVSKKTPNVDHKFLNESENTLQPFLEDFVQGQAKAVYEGSRPDPSAFFKPDYSWIDMSHYTDMMLQFHAAVPMTVNFVISRFDMEEKCAPRTLISFSRSQSICIKRDGADPFLLLMIILLVNQRPHWNFSRV